MADQASAETQRQAVARSGTFTDIVDLSKRSRPGEMVIQWILFFCGFVSIFTTLGIAIILVEESVRFFITSEDVTIIEFLTSTSWQPTLGNFGVAPLVLSTLRTSMIAMLVATPIGLGAAVYLSEYAAPRARSILKPVLEVLAGIPTVVYGYFALTYVTPVILQGILGRDVVEIYNTAAAGIVIGILIIPLIASLSEDALSSVPRALREGAYGLGATKFEAAVKVVFPAALSGILAALIISVSRAIGETMIAALASGAASTFTFNPFVGAETMTAYIARISGGDVSYGTPDYNSIFAIGLLLFTITLSLNILSRYVVRRFQEVYE